MGYSYGRTTDGNYLTTDCGPASFRRLMQHCWDKKGSLWCPVIFLNINYDQNIANVDLYSKFYRLFVTLSAPGDVKSVRCAFFFELLELIKTKITPLICSTTVLDKNLDFWN